MSSTPAQPGRLTTGSVVERQAKFLGRTFTYGYVVSEHEPDRLVELVVERPFPMVVRYELEDADDGTRVHPREGRARAVLPLGDADHVRSGA